MEDYDTTIARRIRDIVAVATDDIDAVLVDVEGGVAYIEGVVASEAQRKSIMVAVRQIVNLRRVITCLAVERVLRGETASEHARNGPLAASVPVSYYSLS